MAKARAYKDRLLNYDRTCLQRTKVIDDESDYYSFDTNVWLSEKEKKYYKKKEEAIREIRHGSRLTKKVSSSVFCVGLVLLESFLHEETVNSAFELCSLRGSGHFVCQPF